MQVPARARSARSHLVTLLILAPVSGLAAQQLDSTRLQELVVTATRAPTPAARLGSSADVLRPEELRRRQIGSLQAALALAPGGTVLQSGGNGGVASLFLRGVSSSQTLFLVDGIRVNDANGSAGSFLGGADLAGMGRLEIVRGPQSTLYGGAAIGGVVSLDASRGSGSASGRAELEGGSFESWRGSLSAGGGTGRLGYSGGFTANGTENQRHPNDWDQRTQVVRLDYRLSGRLEAGATFRGLQQRYISPGDLRTDNTTPEGTTTFESNLATLWLAASPASFWQSRLTAGGQEQFTRGSERFNGGDEFVSTLGNSRRVLDWQNTVVMGTGATLVAGINREWSTATSDGDAMDERLFGAWADLALAPAPALVITGGVRSDDYNTFGSAVTWRLTGAWHIAETGTKLRASLGTGFMPPGLSARFGSAFQDPNPAIRPERSRGWDAGVDQRFEAAGAVVSAAWFHNTLRDLIGFESAPFPAKGRSVNVDRARTSGLELGARLSRGGLDARLGWTLLRAVSLSEPDPSLARLIRRPRHTVSADLSVDVGRRSAAGLGAVVVAGREDMDFNRFPAERVDPGDYAVVRVYGSHRLGRRLELRARVENLLNARYEPVYGYPGLGRSFGLSLAAGF